MKNVTIDVSWLHDAAKDALIESLNTSLDFTRSDLAYANQQLGIKSEVIDRLNATVADLQAKLQQAKGQYVSQPLPTRDYDLENAHGLLATINPTLVDFLAELKVGRYYNAVALMPFGLGCKIKAIPAAKKIERIKMLRTCLPGLSLLTAKDFIEAYTEVEARQKA